MELHCYLAAARPQARLCFKTFHSALVGTLQVYSTAGRKRSGTVDLSSFKTKPSFFLRPLSGPPQVAERCARGGA